MTTDLNTLVRRIPEEIFNNANADAADELFLPNYVDHRTVPPGFPRGSALPKAMSRMLRSAFPDLHMTIEDVLVDGDRAAIRLTVRGTHTGDFMGHPPTGRRVTWTETHIVRCERGKVAEHWVNLDELGRLQQLSAI